MFRKTIGNYFLRTDDGEVVCSMSSTLRKELVYPNADPSSRHPTVDKVRDIRQVDPVAINDEVLFIDAGDGTGMITGVLPRKNKFNRKAFGKMPLEQIIAANIDQIVAVMAARHPKMRWDMLDRFTIGAESLGIPILICINKLDLVDADELKDEMRLYEDLGYPVLYTSAADESGFDELKDALKDKVSVFIGESGVGKSSILNVIEPGLGLKVKDIGKGKKGGEKGQHTTSHLEMFDFGFGGSVIDTPGIRDFGLWDIDKLRIAGLFRDIRPFLGGCKYASDCTHSHEPGCAVKQAVEDGHISERRYKSYLRLMK